MMQQQTYLFYDIETTGLNPCFDQVLQFAAIRTDLELNELERHEFFVRLNRDVIPSPYALITHRIGLSDIQSGDDEYEAIKKIHTLMNTPGTISLGYNTLGFDDEFLRFCFYRNLLPPYTHQYANNCARMDLYPMTVLYYLYKNEALTWPSIDGKTSLKLENLIAANHLAEGQAHNAMVDVEATLALAKLEYQHRTMWDYVIGYFNKKTDLERQVKLNTCFSVQGHAVKEALFIQGKFGAALEYQAPVICLGQHWHYKNQNLWLRMDLEELQKTTPDNLEKTTYVLRKRAGEQEIILPTSERFMQRLNQDRLAIFEANKRFLQENPDVFQAIVDHYLDYKYETNPNTDVDAALYEIDFPSRQEEFLFNQFHTSALPDKLTIAEKFPNSKRFEQAVRIIGRHHPEQLDDKAQTLFSDYCEQINPESGETTLVDFRKQAKLTPLAALDEITAVRNERDLDAEQDKLLDELQNYLSEQFALNATQ